jgi:ABC-type transport system involved in cytochrome c biogenesis permease subunit
VALTAWVPFVFYAAAAAAYLVHFSKREKKAGLTATGLLAAGVVAHTFLIGMQTMEVGYAPLVGTTAAVSAFVWLLGLAYLYVELTTEERAMGAFVTVLLAVLAVLPALNPSPEPRPELLRSPLFTVHVLSMLFAYASFALAFVLGITYVLLFKEIKAKHLGFFYTRLPSLQTLDVMNGRAVVVGWLFLTCGLIIGGVWAMQLHGSSTTDSRVQAMGIGDPKILVALLSWTIYSFALFARRAIGWSGRRAAWLSAFAFVLVLLNLVPVGYFLTRSHNF